MSLQGRRGWARLLVMLRLTLPWVGILPSPFPSQPFSEEGGLRRDGQAPPSRPLGAPDPTSVLQALKVLQKGLSPGSPLAGEFPALVACQLAFPTQSSFQGLPGFP